MKTYIRYANKNSLIKQLSIAGGSTAYTGYGRRGTDELETGQHQRSYTFRSSSKTGKTYFNFISKWSELNVLQV